MDIRTQSKTLRTAISFIGLLLIQLNSTFIYADGTETLGPPSIAIGEGSGLIAAGVGLSGTNQPGDITFTVPAGATVVQALLYWEGYMLDPPNNDGDSEITVNTTAVTGTLIGGPIDIGTTPVSRSYVYRADITSLVSDGANSLTIEDMDFDGVNHGAGVLVIVDDGSAIADIDVRDGNDFAYGKPTIPESMQTTVEQTFNFVPSMEDRAATLDLMFASVFGTASGGEFRPSAINVTVGGVLEVYDNLLDSYDGEEWDTLSLSLTIPAGVDQVKVQALSVDNLETGDLVASLHWITGGLTITPTPPSTFTPGRMTGGGKIKDGRIKVKAALTLHCDITLSNNLQVNWSGKNKWHLQKPITSATCINDPDVEPVPPAAPFDTFIGEGVGKLNGKKGSIARFTFVDGGEPGKHVDGMTISIWAPGDDPDSDKPVLEVSGDLKNGNYQAHYDQPHK